VVPRGGWDAKLLSCGDLLSFPGRPRGRRGCVGLSEVCDW